MLSAYKKCLLINEKKKIHIKLFLKNDLDQHFLHFTPKLEIIIENVLFF